MQAAIEANPGRPVYSATTKGVTVREKFGYWHDVVAKSMVDLDYALIDRTPFQAALTTSAVDDVNLSRIEASPHRVMRTPAGISRRSDDTLIFIFVLAGTYRAEQGTRCATLGVGDGAVFETRRPYTLMFDGAFELATVQVAREAMASHIAGLHDLTAVSFNRRSTLAPLAGRYVAGLLDRHHEMQGSVGRRVGHSLLELLRAVMTEVSAAENRPLTEYRSVSLMRVKEFIEMNIAERDLTPAKVAEALKLSQRYINRLFDSEQNSISRYIWQRRIERSAKDLREAALDSRSISAIALSNGFNDLSHFSKAFRKRFNQSPREYRVG